VLKDGGIVPVKEGEPGYTLTQINKVLLAAFGVDPYIQCLHTKEVLWSNINASAKHQPSAPSTPQLSAHALPSTQIQVFAVVHNFKNYISINVRVICLFLTIKRVLWLNSIYLRQSRRRRSGLKRRELRRSDACVDC
jgi:hypothetical protein